MKKYFLLLIALFVLAFLVGAFKFDVWQLMFKPGDDENLMINGGKQIRDGNFARQKNNRDDKIITAKEYQKLLGVGIDVDWAKNKNDIANYDRKMVADFAKRGFTHVRIRIKESDPQKILPHLKRVISDCLEDGLIPIVAYQAKSFKISPSIQNEQGFINWWQTVAMSLQNYPSRVSFDLIIEVSDQLNKEPDVLNDAYQKALAVIRQTNPTRVIFVSPVVRSAPENLKLLKITNDDKFIMAETHFYASGPDKNNPKKKWTGGTSSEKKIIEQKIKTALLWQKQTSIPVWVGAWMPGNYNKGDDYSIEEQVAFAHFVSRELKKAKIPFAINSDTKFYNNQNKRWHSKMEPVLDAILEED